MCIENCGYCGTDNLDADETDARVEEMFDVEENGLYSVDEWDGCPLLTILEAQPCPNVALLAFFEWEQCADDDSEHTVALAGFVDGDGLEIMISNVEAFHAECEEEYAAPGEENPWQETLDALRTLEAAA